MTRAVITLRSDALRSQATHWIAKAPEGTRIEFRAPQRSQPQNDLMWARLTDVARQMDWHGQKLTATDWKDVFTASLRRARIVPNIDGDGFVQLGLHTSELSKDEMSNLLDLIDAFAAEHGVTFSDSSEPDLPKSEAQASEPAEETKPPFSAGEIADSSAPSLPEGTMILYAAALRRAQKKESLPKYAKQFWDQHDGWEKWKGTPDGKTAAVIFNVFHDNFGNREQIELQLRELI